MDGDEGGDVVTAGAAIYELWIHHKSDLAPRFQSSFPDFFQDAVKESKTTPGQILQLYLIGHNLTGTLSHHIGGFNALQALYLGGNRLTSLPEDIGQLVHLRDLHVGNNRLTQLPSQIGQLTALVALDVNENRLSTLPPQIGELVNLHELVVAKNYLTRLPEEISNLSSTLLALDLSNNCITVFPSPILTLTSLQHLDMDYNGLTNMPLEFCRLSQLEVLHAQGNCLMWIPSTIGALDNMRELHLYDNKLSTIPHSVLTLPHLKSLVMFSNCLLRTYGFDKADTSYNIELRQKNQRLPTKLQLEAFANYPIDRTLLQSNFRLMCKALQVRRYTPGSVWTTVPLCIDAELLAQRWPYLRNLFEAGMTESQTRVLHLQKHFSIQLMEVIVALFYGEAADVGELDTYDCQDLIDHGEQFLLNEPLQVLVDYCRARIDALAKHPVTSSS